MKKLLAVIVLFTITYFLVPTYSFAQEKPAFADKPAVALGIYPPLFEISADPPAVVVAKISIVNQSENPQTLNILFRSFRPSPAGNGQIEYVSDKFGGPDPLILQKIKVYDEDSEISKVDLAPLESKGLKLQINLEAGAPHGDYYFSVIFLSDSKSPDGSGAGTPAGIATNVILSVGKKGPVKGEIEQFKAPFLLGAGPVPFTLLLKNTGEQYIVPSGRITINNMFGGQVGRIDILPQYILARSQRYIIDSQQLPPKGKTAALAAKYNSEHNVMIWPEKFLFGVYTAHLFVKLSSTGPVFQTSLIFIAFPVYLVFAISFLSFVLIGIYIRARKKA